MQNPRAIVITGPCGSGKTSTLAALTALLGDKDISCAGVDMDSLRWFHPTPEGDKLGVEVSRKHLSLIAENYFQMGIPTLVVAEVIESADGRNDLAQAVPQYPLHVVRLRVSMQKISERLRLREIPDRFAWYQNRAEELQDIMVSNGVGDNVIDVNDENPEQVAEMIAAKLELL